MSEHISPQVIEAIHILQKSIEDQSSPDWTKRASLLNGGSAAATQAHFEIAGKYAGEQAIPAAIRAYISTEYLETMSLAWKCHHEPEEADWTEVARRLKVENEEAAQRFYLALLKEFGKGKDADEASREQTPSGGKLETADGEQTEMKKTPDETNTTVDNE